ncbi:hypothetical protein EYF80_019413 [Liparis tanakae]|uniref:Uncharacterized protein n=1 Tax=Liparis tanakae TaxID=230148 RepID=A0A4Z2HXG9_9TELE|nr:hypothetical protein EYF80_019413 [Liparis tanakae]
MEEGKDEVEVEVKKEEGHMRGKERNRDGGVGGRGGRGGAGGSGKCIALLTRTGLSRHAVRRDHCDYDPNETKGTSSSLSKTMQILFVAQTFGGSFRTKNPATNDELGLEPAEDEGQKRKNIQTGVGMRKMCKKEDDILRFLLAAVIARWQGESGEALGLRSEEDMERQI